MGPLQHAVRRLLRERVHSDAQSELLPQTPQTALRKESSFQPRLRASLQHSERRCANARPLPHLHSEPVRDQTKPAGYFRLSSFSSAYSNLAIGAGKFLSGPRHEAARIILVVG